MAVLRRRRWLGDDCVVKGISGGYGGGGTMACGGDNGDVLVAQVRSGGGRGGNGG